MRNKFISGLLFLVTIIMTFYACRSNEYLTEQEESISTTGKFLVKSKRISLKQVNDKIKLTAELEKAKNELKNTKTTVLGKTITYNNFILDTEDIVYIENGPNYHTYTFHILREDQDENMPVENLVFTPLTDGTYRKLLVTYNLTPQEKKIILKGGNVSTKGKTAVTLLGEGATKTTNKTSSQNCGYVTADSYTWCSENVHHSGEGAGECSADVKSHIITVFLYICTSVDDGSGTGGASGPGPGGGYNPGDGSGGGGPGWDGSWECPDPQVLNGPQQPGYDLGDGGCSGVPSTPSVSTFTLFVNNLPVNLKSIINLPANSDFYEGLKKFYDFNSGVKSKNLIKWALQFKQNNSTFTWETFQPMLTYAYNFLEENPDTLNPEQIFIRQKDLNDAVLQNSNFLLDIPCSELDDWQTVAQHNVPQSVKDKLQNIKNQTSWWSNWQITDLDDGASARINMDVFPVQINSLPNKPNSTQKYTPEEFFNFFRLNLNLFAEKFTPIVDNHYGINDTALWNSSNPLGALIHIEIPIDNGTVICSGFGPKAWVFSTIKAPMSMGYDGIHPVAGNRLFGYYVNPSDNKMYIYTRGVDRVSQVATSSPNLANYLIETTAFFGADQLWKGMQDKLSIYINDKGGNASKLPEKTYRPNYTKIRNYLKGKAPLSSLGCN